MNRSALKNYAPKARRAFIQAVTDRAALFGLTAKKTEPITEQGDVAIIGGKAFPRSVADKRQRLQERIERQGFAQTMEAAAYTWFNRLVAIRYMELHGYLGHGYRVLSHPEPDATTPEILQQAEHVDLPGLNRDEVIELKLDGGKESELYRKLLIAQCNALHQAMPFLFERIDDETELLLPDNLLHSDSLVRTLVASIDESDWQEVEIIGWLYQFYISEKKDQVIGKVVKSEDIPAATQLFTPNWIVKYLVQNSLGRQWMATYPDSPLKAKMAYYIEPAEQTPEVQAKLDEITPDSLNPEQLTLLDPACGSGHILVEAYDLLKDIYLERGYRLRDIPALILEKNLFGLEIDDRAAQLAAFALMMKARADDRRIFDGQHQPNVLSIQESNGLDINNIVQAFTAKHVTDESFAPPGEFGFMTPIKAPLLAGAEAEPVGDDQIASDLKALLHLFEDAKTYGSLITIPDGLAKRLPALGVAVQKALASNDMITQRAGQMANAFLSQASVLASRYDAVVANPPYMGSKGQNAKLKKFAKEEHPDSKSDLFAMFLERGFEMAKSHTGHNAMVTMQSWMFLSSYEKMRKSLLDKRTITSMAHLGPRAFGSISGEVVNVTALDTANRPGDGQVGTYFRLIDGGEEEKRKKLKARDQRHTCRQSDFHKIPGSPIAYWVSDALRSVFNSAVLLKDFATPRVGLQTGENAQFVRWWAEVGQDETGLALESREAAKASGLKWFPYNKGGEYRKWYGNQGFVVNWEDDGHEIRNFVDDTGSLRSRPQNVEYYFRPSLSWSKVTSGGFALRVFPQGHLFDVAGCSIFMNTPAEREMLLGCMNSPVMSGALNSLSPTLNFEVGQVADFPVMPGLIKRAADFTPTVEQLVSLAKSDWDAYETSWDFTINPILQESAESLKSGYTAWQTQCRNATERMQQLEEENNRLFIEAYGLQDELSPEVPIEQITLTVNPAYRYGVKLSEAERDERFRQDTMRELVSYAVGCMMGRYSLDEPGLIYAHAGNEGFDPGKYSTFPADEDGIIPITEMDWFDDDASRRLEQFIAAVWPTETLEDNLKWLAASLGPKKSEDARATLRRYTSNGFYKHHLQTYKNRPIYWLFSSGKQGAFQALVYLHRYNEGTLARMRTEYVIPLQGKISARIQQLEGDKAKATSASHRNRIQKEQDTLRKHQDELRAFDEKLRHYADQRIALDLDDGVKVNYAKFGDLLAEVRAVCGKDES